MSERRRILIIEDNPMNMELLTDILEAGGYEVLQSVNAEEGIALARSARPHTILMDIQLPGMDGLEATKILKSSEETSSIRVIAITSHAMVGYDTVVAEAGCDGYITKPINTRTILDQIYGR